ncbi:adenylate kinase [Candidatus Aerophobetes bacterium]|uniref:Adenylate kinase n=1 Tax=Aerophobetes bacterium TaxID=2030807 RepID=A0A2A4YEJ3_UNCAE|nr:MAG: adenylate kinase [Candidatus Aerophobetes bacterium]
MENHETKKPLVIILLGPPGVGKGSQAEKISSHLHLPHISTGDILRENIKNSTDLGKKAKSIMEEGKLVPDALINEMAFDRVEKADCKKGYILDGYPRTTAQAEVLSKHLGKDADIKVINFFASDETVATRISGRLICKKCKTSFHRAFKKPKKEDVCDKCGGELYQRADDHMDTVLKRLQVYKEQTEPLIQYFDQKKLLKTILCEKGMDEIFNETLAFLK